jgi:hypothetical protein
VGWCETVVLWCQQEGAALEKYSQGEVKELLAAGEESLPQELTDLISKRYVAPACHLVIKDASLPSTSFPRSA